MTVPNKPTNGAVEPIVASVLSPCLSFLVRATDRTLHGTPSSFHNSIFRCHVDPAFALWVRHRQRQASAMLRCSVSFVFGLCFKKNDGKGHGAFVLPRSTGQWPIEQDGFGEVPRAATSDRTPGAPAQPPTKVRFRQAIIPKTDRGFFTGHRPRSLHP